MRIGQIHAEKQCDHVWIIRGYEQGRTFEDKDPYILRADIVQEPDDPKACEIKAVMLRGGIVDWLCRLPFVGWMIYSVLNFYEVVDINDKHVAANKSVALAALIGYDRIWITRDKPVKGATFIDGRWLHTIINCIGN